MIAIVDYGAGNVRSVYNALDYIGTEALITSRPREIDNATHLILPGVGAFGDAMRSLESRHLVDVLERQVMKKGKPLLGICLGLQLLAELGFEHGTTRGLGWIKGKVVRLDPGNQRLKIPHVGWNDVRPRRDSILFANFPEDPLDFYFVHSFHLCCDQQDDVVAECEYDLPFVAAVQKGNIFATQFHPEKSQDNGVQLLKNFISGAN